MTETVLLVLFVMAGADGWAVEEITMPSREACIALRRGDPDRLQALAEPGHIVAAAACIARKGDPKKAPQRAPGLDS